MSVNAKILSAAWFVARALRPIKTTYMVEVHPLNIYPEICAIECNKLVSCGFRTQEYLKSPPSNHTRCFLKIATRVSTDYFKNIHVSIEESSDGRKNRKLQNVSISRIYSSDENE